MKATQPAKALLIAAVIGLGLSGGLAAAALLPGGSAPAAISQAWDQTVGKVFGHGPGDRGSYFTAAAAFIGVTEAQLRTELGTDKSLADVATAHGKTRADLIAALVAAEQQDIGALVDRKGIGARPSPGTGRGPGPGGSGRGPGANVTGDPLAAAAAYLGTTPADLQTKLRAGQSLAQIAGTTPGHDRTGLVAALVNDAKAKIAAAQTAGTITAARATELTDELADRMARFVDSAGDGPRRGR